MIKTKALQYIKEVIDSGKSAGDGYYTEKCQKWLEKKLHSKKVLMMTSCTHALETIFQLLDLKDYEVIMPSYNFPSTANAVLMNGGKVIFTEVNHSDLCIDVNRIEEKITSKTKAILVVHYGGNSCQMDEVMKIASQYNLYVIEDAAQGLLGTYKGQYLGTIGHFGCFSFHETKNITSGEGGALSINIDDSVVVNKAEIIRQKGTNRKAFDKGLVSHYEWVDKGSSYSPSELLMAYLYAQLEVAEQIQEKRTSIFNQYNEHFSRMSYECLFMFSNGNQYGENNAHIFYIVFKDELQAKIFIEKFAQENYKAITHFVPLHLSEMGNRIGYDIIDFPFEEFLYKRLVRLPIDLNYDDLIMKNILKIIHDILKEF